MKNEIDKIISDVIAREGGYVNHRADRGGATNYGITQETLSDWLGRPASPADIKAMTLDTARKIYEQQYIMKPNYHRLPAPIAIAMVDFAVHSGVSRATRALQHILGVKVDGVIGDKTLAAAHAFLPHILLNEIMLQRSFLLLRLIGADHDQATFATGWANRLEKLQKELLQMLKDKSNDD